MREILARLGEDIHLGRRGENLATCVIFDVSEWQGAGEGTVHLLHQRNGDEYPYPCAITVEDGVASWVVTAADVEVAGRGKAELQYLDGEVCIKSAVFTTRTQRSLGKADEAPPEPEEGWVSKVLKAGGSALESAEAAQISESNAKVSAESAANSADFARGCKNSALNYVADAKNAAQAAADSRQAAADSAQAAADSAQRAASYENFADGHMQDARLAAEEAAMSANAAETAAADAEAIAAWVGAAIVSDTLTWDGNTDGLLCVEGYYKVSDAVPTKNDFANGCTVVYDGKETVYDGERAQWWFFDNWGEDYDGFCMGPDFFIIPYDNFVLDEVLPFPEAGVYLDRTGDAYVSYLTIPGYTGFETNTINPDYVPGLNHLSEVIRQLSEEIAAREDIAVVDGTVVFKVAGKYSVVDSTVIM